MMLVGLLFAGVSLIGLICNFISLKTTVLGVSSTSHLSLKEWFDTINNYQDIDEIANWQVARVLLIVTTVLLVVMAVLMLAKCLVKHPFLKWSTLGLSIAVIVCALIFMIMTFSGCQALSGNIIIAGAEYMASVGVYLLGIGAMLSAVMALVVALRK